MVHFDPKPGEQYRFNGRVYSVATHPQSPHFPYAMEGGRGIVYQVIAEDGKPDALKVFHHKYRNEAIKDITNRLQPFATWEGLTVCGREVFTHSTHARAISDYPALEFAVLMPWITGQTWYDIVMGKCPIGKRNGWLVATSLAHILARLEQNEMAHCDIAGPNVLVIFQQSKVELVDVEEMYLPGVSCPRENPTELNGQGGYRHKKSTKEGQWHRHGDRFAASVLIAEMLTWHLDPIRAASEAESFFSEDEIQDKSCPRYNLIYDALQNEYSDEVAEQFRKAWESDEFSDCPSLNDWSLVLSHIDVPEEVVAVPLADFIYEKVAWQPSRDPQLPKNVTRIRLDSQTLSGARFIPSLLQTGAPIVSWLKSSLLSVQFLVLATIIGLSLLLAGINISRNKTSFAPNVSSNAFDSNVSSNAMGGLLVVNNSNTDICSLYLTPSNQASPNWSNNPFEGNPIYRGKSNDTGAIITPGRYDIWIGDCSGTKVYTKQNFNIKSGVMRRIELVARDFTTMTDSSSDDNVESSPNPTQEQHPTVPFSCPDAPAPRLVVGETGYVDITQNLANRVRSGPSLSGTIKGALQPGDGFKVLGGPKCSDGYVWWSIRANDGSVSGWTAEGVPGQYWLVPAQAE